MAKHLKRSTSSLWIPPCSAAVANRLLIETLVQLGQAATVQAWFDDRLVDEPPVVQERAV